ncbi:dde superfamily endonuclease [Holotrichia oblita]|uniref:Dde superfamily endonuclease n=1 Tax=Holotrichia oblita TaxID=644536 RepID=A0ACB9SYC5_HOLOL|nr:dde superfamily endonuclease [Holotrichia oblita]
MSEKSAYVNNFIFYKRVRAQFVPRKPAGSVLLIPDGHSSHCSDTEMLEYCPENDIILVCLPSHTTQFLQPLDRCVFKSLKLHYYNACNLYIKNNPGRKITRLQFGKLLATAWKDSATVDNATSAFAATGIAPFNPCAIPNYAYLNEGAALQSNPHEQTHISTTEHAGRSHITAEDSLEMMEVEENNLDDSQCSRNNWKIAERNILIPIIPSALSSVRKKGKQLATVLTDNEHIKAQKEKAKSSQKAKKKPETLKSKRGNSNTKTTKKVRRSLS